MRTLLLSRINVLLFALTFAVPAYAFDLRFAASTDPELAAELRQTSLLAQAKTAEERNPQDILAAAQADYARLISVLYEAGHFGPEISIKVDGREAATIAPVAPPKVIGQVSVSIKVGPIFKFGRTNIAPLASGTELPESFAPGERAGIGPLRDAVSAGVEGWRAQGFAKAGLQDQQITARHPARALDADIRLNPGPQLRFGDLIIKGNKDVRTERIQDIAGLPSGQVFDPKELDRVSTRLRRTGAFNVVALSEADQIGPNDTLPITATLVEEKPRRFGFGAELSTQEGLSLSGFWLHRNLLGGAERLRVDGDVEGIGGQTGGTDYRLGLSFNRPATFNEDTDFFASTQLESLDEEEFNADTFSIEAGIRRYARPEREYTFGLGLRYARTEDAFGEREYTIFTLPASATFDYRNSSLNATEGYYAQLQLTPFLSIDGTENGLLTYADLRGYHSFGEGERFTFAARAQLGSVAGPSLETAPADFLFYSGGSGTVRGQEYQSLGVTLGNGQEVGGRSFLGLAAELRAKTGDNLSVVGFFDAGYIGREAFPDGSSGDWHTGAGLGIRYDTGIGPIRLDVGVPISGPGDNNGFEVYIGIGQAF